MKCALFLTCLAVVVCAASAWPNRQRNGYRGYYRPYWFRSFWDYLCNLYRNQQSQMSDGCVSKGISLEEKLRLIGESNDDNNDGVVTTSDIIYDVTNNYDTNGDGIWTTRECVKRWECAYGDTTLKATFICNMLMRGEANMSISVFNNIPRFVAGMPLDDFIEMNRGRYERFSNDQCLDRCVSREEKLSLNIANNDNNNDGVVSLADIVNDLNNNYDKDNDGVVTKEEWVLTWVCLYGDSGDYARFLWQQMTQDTGVLDINNLPFAAGFANPVRNEDFVNTNRQNYETFYQNNPEPKCVDANSQKRPRFPWFG